MFSLDKAIILLKSALRKYEDGKISQADKDRKMANEIFDRLEVDKAEVEYKDKQLYGENYNFGILTKVIEESLLYIIAEEKYEILREYVNMIKSNNVLKEEYNFYKNLYKTNNQHIENYVNVILENKKNYNKKEIKENNQLLIDFIRKHKINEFVDISPLTLRLYEAIEYLYLNKNLPENSDTFYQNLELIKENLSIKENLLKENNEDANLKEDTIFKTKIDKNSKKVFNDYKKDTLKILKLAKEKIDNDEEKGRLDDIINQINNINYEEETFTKHYNNFNNIIEELLN